jgi:hypothetical protein
VTITLASVLAVLCIVLQAICLLGLLYGAVRFRQWILILLAVTLIVWPLAGDGLNLWARHAQTVPAGMTAGEFVATVAWIANSVETLLIVAVTALCLLRVRRQRPAGADAHGLPGEQLEQPTPMETKP